MPHLLTPISYTYCVKFAPDSISEKENAITYYVAKYKWNSKINIESCEWYTLCQTAYLVPTKCIHRTNIYNTKRRLL